MGKLVSFHGETISGVHDAPSPLIFVKEILNRRFQRVIQPSEGTKSVIPNAFAKTRDFSFKIRVLTTAFLLLTASSYSFIQVFIWQISYSSTFNITAFSVGLDYFVFYPCGKSVIWYIVFTCDS